MCNKYNDMFSHTYPHAQTYQNFIIDVESQILVWNQIGNIFRHIQRKREKRELIKL